MGRPVWRTPSRAFSNAFSVPAAAVSLVVSVFFAGASLSILAAGLLVRRFGYRRVLTSAMVALGLGALLMAFAPAWPVVLVAVLFALFAVVPFVDAIANVALFAVAGLLVAAGWTPQWFRLIDLFADTPHVEVVSCFTR